MAWGRWLMVLPTGLSRRTRTHDACEEDAEARLYAALEAAGFVDVMRCASGHAVDAALIFVRHFPWGAYLTRPRRGFDAAAGLPVLRILVEIDGGARAASRAKVGAAGWRVITAPPSDVETAVEQVLEAAGTSSP